MIEFREYAEIDIPDAWKSWRSPVIYIGGTPPNKAYENGIDDLGIDFNNLHWKMVPERDNEYIQNYFKINENMINLKIKNLVENNKNYCQLADQKIQLARLYVYYAVSPSTLNNAKFLTFQPKYSSSIDSAVGTW